MFVEKRSDGVGVSGLKGPDGKVVDGESLENHEGFPSLSKIAGSVKGLFR